GQRFAHLGFLQDSEDLFLGVMFLHVGCSLFSPGSLAHATPVSGGQVNRASVADKYPFIVPPIFDKTPLMTHESIRSIWAEAAQALVNTNQLFAIGYSLPKSDSALGYFLKNNLNSEASVEVVSKSADLVKRFEEALPKHKGKIAQNFSGDNAVLDFVAALKA
ncbi:MAG TPA: hypothetical protein VG710_00200, partial [Opitutus sp.]|nr:hypothetical protein [Opitutus sp.]